MNTYGHKLSAWGEIHLKCSKMGCIPANYISRHMQNHMYTLEGALQPFFMALGLSGRPVPRMLGESMSNRGGILYWAELTHGFFEVMIIPVSYRIFWTRYKIRHYFGDKKNKLYTLDEVVQEFSEVYDKLGDMTVAHA